MAGPELRVRDLAQDRAPAMGKDSLHRFLSTPPLRPAPRSHPPARTLCARHGSESTRFRAISPRRLRRGGATVRDFGQLDAYVADHRDGWIAELADAARQPSVSATG